MPLPPRHDDRTFLIAALAALLASLLVFWVILDVVVLSSSLAVVLMPLYRRLTPRTGDTVASIVVCLLVFISVVAFLGFTVWVFYSNEAYINELIATIFKWVESPQSASLLSTFSIEQPRAVLFLHDIGDTFSRYVTTIAGQFLLIGVKVILFFVFLFLFFWRGEKIFGILAGSIPPKAPRIIRFSHMLGSRHTLCNLRCPRCHCRCYFPHRLPVLPAAWRRSCPLPRHGIRYHETEPSYRALPDRDCPWYQGPLRV